MSFAYMQDFLWKDLRKLGRVPPGRRLGDRKGGGGCGMGVGQNTTAYSFVPSERNYYLFNNQIKVDLVLLPAACLQQFTPGFRVLGTQAGERGRCTLSQLPQLPQQPTQVNLAKPRPPFRRLRFQLCVVFTNELISLP